MPLLDRSLPHDELVLICPLPADVSYPSDDARPGSESHPHGDARPSDARPNDNLGKADTPARIPLPTLPQGYRWCSHPEQRRSQWVQLMGACGFPYTAVEAQGFWDAMDAADPTIFATNLFFILDAENNLAATCGLWPGTHLGPSGWRLHWVMCAPKHQGRGLAEAACLAACNAYRRMPVRGASLYVVTQAQSWAAIRLYEKLGFVPYEGATCKASAQKNRTAWEQARKLIKERYGYEV